MEDDEQEQEDRLQTLTLALYDLYWFRRLILFKLPHPPPPPSPPSPPPPASSSPSPPPAILVRHRSVHRRSRSDDLSSSPVLRVQPPRLQTVFSGKESAEVFESFAIRAERERGWGGRRRERRRRKRGSESSSSSKSLSDLEFEELKGFMDLGFTFSDADSDPRLREIVPGLQRLNKAEDVLEGSSCASSGDAEVAVTRPYLSEAWDVAEEEEERMMRNLTIAVGGSEVDLKEQLRFWAQAVASTVR